MFKGGYVEARRSAYATVGLDEADYVDIDNGYNDLRPLDYETNQLSSLACENYANCGYKVIEGTLINNSGPVIADNNKWQLNNLLPLQSSGYPNGGKDKYTNVTDINTGNTVHFNASVQSDKAPCDFLKAVCPGCEIKRNFLENCPECSVINTPEFVNVKTNDAVKLALSTMDGTAVDGYKHAVTMLYEVLKYPLANPSEGDKYVTRIAEKKILISLAEAIERGQIITSENSMAPEVVKVLDYEDYKMTEAAAENKPVNGLYAALEKASIYYTAEHRAEALNLLDGMLPSVPVKNLDYVNHMRCVINNELQLLHHQIDQAEFIQHSSECIPARKENLNRRYISLSAENEAIQIEQDIIVKVYPNPASNKLTIEYSSQENEAAQFIIYDITGKAVFKKELKSNTQKMEINDFSLSNGIYFYRIFTSDKIIQQDKLTIAN
jgi:hypothetical protein